MDMKQLRTEKGYSQGEVAVKVGVSLTTYQTWERGYGKPSPENLKKLKKVLGIK